MLSKKINLETTFIIAEIGQNHQGDFDIAMKLIKTAKQCGADCVKFQKTDINEKFTSSTLNRPYTSPHSFGRTYGEHKAFLEFNKAQFRALQRYAAELGILFTASAMDVKSLDFLIEIDVPFIKIGSGDANNLIMIEKAAVSKIPLVISTGMQSVETIKRIYEIVSKYHKNFALLHCVSAYPTPFEDVNLNVISWLKKEFPDIVVGYSGHELGIHVSTAAVALGSKIIERHLTLDKNLKGSDHKCSLEPPEFAQLVENIRSLEKALGNSVKTFQTSELLCYEKLGKSLVYAEKLQKNHKLTYQDLNIKVAVPKGIDGSELNQVVGMILIKDVDEDESVQKEHLL